MNWQDCGPAHDGDGDVDGGDGDGDDGDDGDGDEDENLMPCTDTASVISCALSPHGGKVRRADD